MTHLFKSPKPRVTRAAAESAHQKALNDLIDVSRRQGAAEALEMAHALAVANGDHSAVAFAALLNAVRLSLKP